MDELLREYANSFGENFPIRFFMGTDEEDIMQVIKKCLKDNKPYIANYKDKAVY